MSFLDLADGGLTNFTTVGDIATGTKPYYDAQANALYLMTTASKLVQYNFPI